MINLIVAVVLTFAFRAMKLPEGTDETQTLDYKADAGDERVKELDVDDLATDTPTGRP